MRKHVEKKNSHYKLNYSGIKDCGWGLVNLCDHTFFLRLLGGGSVVDGGANQGIFSSTLVRLLGGRAVGVEPVPSLFSVLPVVPGIRWQHAALSADEGTVRIFLHPDRCASTAVAEDSVGDFVEVRSMSLTTLLREEGVGKLDLIKLDIEGEEVPLLEGFDIPKGTGQITVEFHDFLYPELKPRVEAIKARIERAGYYCIPFSLTTNGDVLFVNRALISWWKYCWIKYFWRWVLGGGRKLRKISRAKGTGTA